MTQSYKPGDDAPVTMVSLLDDPANPNVQKLVFFGEDGKMIQEEAIDMREIMGIERLWMPYRKACAELHDAKDKLKTLETRRDANIDREKKIREEFEEIERVMEPGWFERNRDWTWDDTEKHVYWALAGIGAFMALWSLISKIVTPN